MSNLLSRPCPDADSRPYWEGVDAGELRIQRCASCGTPRFYPRVLCPKCWSDDAEWLVASGNGTVYSSSVVRQAPGSQFVDDLPYVVALVDLDEGVRVFSRVVGENSLDVAIGDRVTARIPENSIPVFERSLSA